MSKTKFDSHKQYLCGLLSSGNAKKTVQTKVYYTFLAQSEIKKKNSQTFKNRSCEKLFLQSVCYWYNLLRYFLFYVITGRILFFLEVHLCSELFLTAMLLLSLKKVS